MEIIRSPVKYQRANVMIRRDFYYVLKVLAARYNTNVSRLLNSIISNFILEDREAQEVLLEWHRERSGKPNATG
jgi:hypothetical protein